MAQCEVVTPEFLLSIFYYFTSEKYTTQVFRGSIQDTCNTYLPLTFVVIKYVPHKVYLQSHSQATSTSQYFDFYLGCFGSKLGLTFFTCN